MIRFTINPDHRYAAQVSPPIASELRLISTDAFLATLVNRHVNFNHVNKIEARYKVLSVNEKLSEVQILRLRVTFHALPLFYLRT